MTIITAVMGMLGVALQGVIVAVILLQRARRAEAKLEIARRLLANIGILPEPLVMGELLDFIAERKPLYITTRDVLKMALSHLDSRGVK